MQAVALLFCSCGIWGLMAVWNNGLVSPGFYSGISCLRGGGSGYSTVHKAGES